MRRRDVLAGVGLAGTSLGLSAPAIAQGSRHLTMVTDWPEGPGMLQSARRLAETIDSVTGGRIKIEVSPSGTVVRPFETFDAVQAGVADMFHTHIGYFEDKSPAFQFYSGLPFGLTSNELMAWVKFGGGQELWDELGAQFDVKPLLCCSPGAQMGGWFLKEIVSPESFQGLRYRMAGLGAEVFRRLGAIVVLLPAAEIVPSLESGAIDACEWVGPWLDMEMGLHEVASHYYYPGWHEPGAALTLGINRGVWESFTASDQRMIEAVAVGEYAVSLAEFNANNARALDRLRTENKVHIQAFPQALLKTFAEISDEVVAIAGSADEISRRIFRSYSDFRAEISGWTEISEGASIAARKPS
jgi:TRAP-type mannitol/chloroaromatic compound transport system substrate-binding protein